MPDEPLTISPDVLCLLLGQRVAEIYALRTLLAQQALRIEELEAALAGSTTPSGTPSGTPSTKRGGADGRPTDQL